MERVRSVTSSGNGDRRDRGSRRKTVSGPAPDAYKEPNNEQDIPTEEMRLPWSSPSAPTSPISPLPPSNPTPKSSGHKRNISGNILSKLNFLRSNSHGEESRPSLRPGSRDKEATSPTKSMFSRKSVEEEVPPESPTSPNAEKEGALASALKQSKTRKRKGSLRKTALLGGRRIIPEARERKGSFSLLQRPPIMKAVPQEAYPEREQEPANSQVETFEEDDLPITQSKPEDAIPLSARRQFTYENAVASSSSDSSWSEPPGISQARLSLLTDTTDPAATTGARTMVNELGSPLDVKSPTSQASYASTTDDEEILTFSLPPKTLPSQTSLASSNFTAPFSSAATSTSYFPAPSEPSTLSLTTRRQNSKRSPLSRTLPMSMSTPIPGTSPSIEPHDYTETEYWGWVILFITWITFAVGMGSCLGIWSWAWDVGETPYAPPDLQDDPELPIVGYYPALIVLTGVVAWVWITVAWVGMKYFRHAKIEV